MLTDMADSPDAYEQMTLAELRKIADKRPVRSVYLRKAELIAELRTLDARVAAGEPEGHVEHAFWRAEQATAAFKEHARQQGLDEAEQRIMSLLEQPGYSPSFQAGLRAAISLMHGKERPSDEDWDSHVETLEQLLSSLSWAGWELPESYGTEFDFEHGAMLFGQMTRTNMVIVFQYDADANVLTLAPDDVGGFDGELSMLDEDISISLPAGGQGSAEVEAIAGAQGLLDPTNIHAAEDSDVTTAELLGQLYAEHVFQPAQQYSKLPLDQMLEDPFLAPFLKAVCFFAGQGVVPDLVPDSAALGIAAWCWRNNTAVEAHHLPDDVLMARVNIAATKAVRGLIDPYDGVDWVEVEAALTSDSWALGDGRVVSALFGDGWGEVQRTVREQVKAWRRLDEEVLGPQATMRLLTVGGATDYSRHWWGQGRWAEICRRIVLDAKELGVALPAPFDQAGAEAFIEAAKDPDNLSDDALNWLIDVPPTDAGQVVGLRFHKATRPIVREFELFEFETP